jgi:cell division protein FtsB
MARRRSSLPERMTWSAFLKSLPFDASRSGVRLVVLILVILALGLLVNFVGQVVAGAQLSRQISEREADIALLAAQNDALQEQLEFALSPAYAEQVAREQLGLAREGDTVILPTLPDRPVEQQPEVPVPLPEPTIIPNWQGWVQAFFSDDLKATLP